MALRFQDNGSTRISRVTLIVFLALSVVLMSVYSNEGAQGVLHRLQQQVHAISSPFQLAGSAGGAGLDAASDAMGNITANGGTLSELRQQNAELKKMVTQGEEYRLEVQRLQELLNMKETYDIQGVTGRVIGRSTDAWSQTITLSVGSSDGVEQGLTVIGPSGVVGQVISVSPGSSTVRLISDPQSGVAAMIQSSRAEGIVRGSLNGILYLENIGADITVQVGDVVLTSGLGGSYQKGLLIGTVVRVDGNPIDGTRSIIVAQNEKISSLEEVIVVQSASSDGNRMPNVKDISNSSSSAATAAPSQGQGALSDDEKVDVTTTSSSNAEGEADGS